MSDKAAMSDVGGIVKGLTKAQRESIAACRKRGTGAGGERWDFSVLPAGTRAALTNKGIAKPWGMVSASLTPLGLAVRSALMKEKAL